MVSDAKVLDLEKDGSGKGLSNKLVLVSRTERDVVWSAHTIAPITESIKSRLARQLRIVSRNRRLHSVLKFLTNEENMWYALRGHRIVYRPGRTRHHPRCRWSGSLKIRMPNPIHVGTQATHL